ncbi:MAG TPA: GH1 family beta-glucosidase [Bryobacteraceae bacterium]|nr:GH1 family beta-glucosidase [Bryobacteraceae bacterium]
MSLTHPTRRGFGKAVGSAALGAYALPGAHAEPGRAAGRPFPANFLWGCATASYQIEGAVAEDGRKASIWDTYSHTPGKIAGGDTGDEADDSYHRYKEDVALLKSLGVRSYRYSVAWPRVFPDGTGAVNDKGMAYYDRLTDAVLAAGIEPWVTLYHWDLPQALEDRWGGWESADTSKAFADYAAFVAKHLSDRVHHFFTINEFACIADQGYGLDDKAPGKKLAAGPLNQVRHHAVLGHGLATEAIRAAVRAGTRLGLAENANTAVPVIETKEHLEAARKAMRLINGPFLTAVLEGAYPPEYLAAAGKDAPKFTPAEMKAIGSPLDFIGLNIYAPTHVRADESPLGFAEVPHPASYPYMNSDWLFIDPAIAYWAPRHLAEIWKVKEVYITENGCSSSDVMDAGGQIYDTDRVMYLRTHLAEAQRAIAEGWPLRGYFLWSLMDNFEWKYGYQKRFGLYHVDFKTQKRTPKLSAHYYRELIRRNAMV